MLSGYKELFKILLLMSSRISTFIQALHWNEERQQSGDDILIKIRLIQQQNGNVSRRRESAQKGLNATSGAQFASLQLAIPVV